MGGNRLHNESYEQHEPLQDMEHIWDNFEKEHFRRGVLALGWGNWMQIAIDFVRSYANRLKDKEHDYYLDLIDAFKENRAMAVPALNDAPGNDNVPALDDAPGSDDVPALDGNNNVPALDDVHAIDYALPNIDDAIVGTDSDTVVIVEV